MYYIISRAALLRAKWNRSQRRIDGAGGAIRVTVREARSGTHREVPAVRIISGCCETASSGFPSNGYRKLRSTQIRRYSNKNRAFHCCKALCFHFYSCSKKAGACTAATRYPFSNLHADSTSLFSYHKNNGRTAGFSTRCARYRPRRMPSSLSTSKYNMIADTSAAARAVTVLSNRQTNVCAKKRVHR